MGMEAAQSSGLGVLQGTRWLHSSYNNNMKTQVINKFGIKEKNQQIQQRRIS